MSYSLRCTIVHYWKNKICTRPFKNKTPWKIGLENCVPFFWCPQMRALVEKVDMLSWKQSFGDFFIKSIFHFYSTKHLINIKGMLIQTLKLKVWNQKKLWYLSKYPNYVFKPYILKLQHNIITHKPFSKGSAMNTTF